MNKISGSACSEILYFQLNQQIMILVSCTKTILKVCSKILETLCSFPVTENNPSLQTLFAGTFTNFLVKWCRNIKVTHFKLLLFEKIVPLFFSILQLLLTNSIYDYDFTSNFFQSVIISLEKGEKGKCSIHLKWFRKIKFYSLILIHRRSYAV